jgi:hypothetical protein
MTTNIKPENAELLLLLLEGLATELEELTMGLELPEPAVLEPELSEPEPPELEWLGLELLELEPLELPWETLCPTAASVTGT